MSTKTRHAELELIADPAARLAALVDTRNDAATAAEKVEALVDWLAQSEIGPWVAGRMLDLAAHLAEQGRPIVRPANRRDISVELVALLDAHHGKWAGQGWRRAQVAEWVMGQTPAERRQVEREHLIDILADGPAFTREQAAQVADSPALLGAVIRAVSSAPAAAIPAPADFDERPLIGRLPGGVTVYGDQGWCEIAGTVTRYAVEAEIAGLVVTCDGEHVAFPEMTNNLGELKLSALGTLIELQQAGHLDQLVRLARRWLGGAPAPTLRKAA